MKEGELEMGKLALKRVQSSSLLNQLDKEGRGGGAGVDTTANKFEKKGGRGRPTF